MFTQLTLDSTLRQCLVGKKIIEYPTFVVGIRAHTMKLRLMIREIETLSHVEDSGESDVMGDAMGKVIADTAVSPSGDGADDFLSPNKKRQLEDLSSSAKKIRINGTKSENIASTEGTGVGWNVGDCVEEDEEVEEEEEDQKFLQQLVDLESADISTLQSLIRNMEEE